MDLKNSCRCCLQSPPEMDLTTPYTYLGKTEIYSDMLKECFDLNLTLDSDGSRGICSVCVGRLRDANNFKMQVQHSQAELQALLDGDNKKIIFKFELTDESSDDCVYDESYEIPIKAEMASEDKILYYEDSPVKSETPNDVISDTGRLTTYSRQLAKESYNSAECNNGFTNNSTPSLDSTVPFLQFPCDSCNSKFPTKLLLSEHEKVEHDNNYTTTMKCSECDFTTNNKRILLGHIKHHTVKKLFNCDQCSYKSVYKANLLQHVMIHTGEKPYKCEQCNYKCARKDKFRNHQLKHTDEKPFKCDICDFKCKRKIELQRHQMTHTGEKPYLCSHCDYQCTCLTHLKRHERIHTGDKRHKCSQCDYKTVDKSHLRRHERIHSGILPFKCNICDYQCREKAHLRYHQMKHAGKKPNECSECGFKCTRKADLKTHMRIHTGEKPYECDHCSYACRQRHVLQGHMKSKHPG